MTNTHCHTTPDADAFLGRVTGVSFLLVSFLLVLCSPDGLRAKEKSKISGSMSNTGADADASARVKASFKGPKSQLKLTVKDLDAQKDYQLRVGGQSRGSFQTDSRGRARLRFRTHRAPFLTFDPRGESLSITDGNVDVLQIDLSGSSPERSLKLDERTALDATALAAGSSAEVRFRVKNGERELRVDLRDVPPGEYEIFVGGALRGSIVVPEGRNRGRLELESDSPTSPLDFDPIGEKIDIVQDGDVQFSDDMRSDAGGVNDCSFSETRIPIASTGADPDGKADARFRVRDDCDRDFRVEIEDVPVGDYDLLVAGVKRGTITVADQGDEIEGEIEFDTDPDDPDELFLDFDPRGESLEVSQGETVFFSGNFDPNNAPNSPPGPPDCDGREIRTEVPLFNQGVLNSAKGKARFRIDDDCDRDFRVEIEDLPLGDYDLFVGGSLRGTITVVFQGDENEGELEFDTDVDEPGEVFLDFDPRGQEIQVRDGNGSVILERTFPS